MIGGEGEATTFNPGAGITGCAGENVDESDGEDSMPLKKTGARTSTWKSMHYSDGEDDTPPKRPAPSSEVFADEECYDSESSYAGSEYAEELDEDNEELEHLDMEEGELEDLLGKGALREERELDLYLETAP